MKRSERMNQARVRAAQREVDRAELVARRVEERVNTELLAAGETALVIPRRETTAETRERLRKTAPAFVAVSHRAVPSAEPPRRDGTVPIEIEQVLASLIFVAFFFMAHCPTEGALTVRAVIGWVLFLVLVLLLIFERHALGIVGP